MSPFDVPLFFQGIIWFGGGGEPVVARVTGDGCDLASGAQGEIRSTAEGSRDGDRARCQVRGGELRHAVDQGLAADLIRSSLNVTVPPLGVAPPGDKSLTVAVNVTDWPVTAEVVEAYMPVRAGSALNRASCSRRPTWGRNRACDASLGQRLLRGPTRPQRGDSRNRRNSKRKPSRCQLVRSNENRGLTNNR